MSKERKWQEWIRRVGLFRHRKYEELSVLAATGQLGGSQMCELNEHIRTCSHCQNFFESAVQVSVQTMPLLMAENGRAGDIAPPEGIQARFLGRLAMEERKQFSPRGPVPIQKFANSIRGSSGGRSGRREDREESASWALWKRGPAVVLSSCVVCAVCGVFVGTWIKKPRVSTFHEISKSMVTAENPGVSSERIAELERQNAKFAGELASLSVGLSNAKNEELALTEKLAAANLRLALANSQNTTSAEHSTASVTANEEVTILQEETRRLRAKLAESQSVLTEKERATEELQARLESATDDLQHEQELASAKRQLGDVASARNLHIVDVYDADGKGKRQPAFGRVFYIEGKSLVFYAYDLKTPKNLSANVVFHVWGGKAGVKEATHSLGLLRSDDSAEGRWAMTFDDPNVLAQINSVFVTVEARNKTYESPRGKKVLYAYLGNSPNHP